VWGGGLGRLAQITLFCGHPARGVRVLVRAVVQIAVHVGEAIIGFICALSYGVEAQILERLRVVGGPGRGAGAESIVFNN